MEPLPYFVIGLQDSSMEILRIGDSNDDGMQLISGHEDAVNSLVWVRELQCLVSGAADGVICAWDTRNSDGNISACVRTSVAQQCGPPGALASLVPLAIHKEFPTPFTLPTGCHSHGALFAQNGTPTKGACCCEI